MSRRHQLYRAGGCTHVGPAVPCRRAAGIVYAAAALPVGYDAAGGAAVRGRERVAPPAMHWWRQAHAQAVALMVKVVAAAWHAHVFGHAPTPPAA